MFKPRPIWRRLLLHFADRADAFALANAGNNSAARMAMMAMTTRSSIRVKPRSDLVWNPIFIEVVRCSLRTPVRFVVPVPLAPRLNAFLKENPFQPLTFRVSVAEGQVPFAGVPHRG